MEFPFDKGTQVKVRGERGLFYVTGNKTTVDGKKEVTVYGGLRPMFRTFYADRIVIPRKKRVRNVSG